MADPRPDDAVREWRREAAITVRLAWPLVIAQFASMALAATDVVMMGWLGTNQLAAGTLGTALMHPLLMFGMGVTLAVSPMIAQALGARRYRSVRRTTRQGLWIAFLCAAPMIVALNHAEAIYAALGQDPRLSALAQGYLTYAAWGFPPFLAMSVLRGLVSAYGLTRVVLVISIAGIFVNAAGNYALMFGAFGFPRLELRGAGISTALVHTVMCLMLLGYIVRHRKLKRLAILVRFWKPDWPRFLRILRLGLPIGLTITAESGLFSGAAVLMGWLGAESLAAHAIALQVAAFAFMGPLGLSQATTIRAGLAYGRRDREALARAGWTSIGIALCYMTCTALLLWAAPGLFVGLFLDSNDPSNGQAIALAVSFLAVAALFQLVDGTQVAAAAALRGMSDTTKPMMIAIVGYWVIGLPTGYILGFPLGLGGVGVWLGLASGLAAVAVALTWRFARMSAKRIPIRAEAD